MFNQPRRSFIMGRHIFAFIKKAFNAVDVQRVKEVGPDRACAEWILKNGGAVRFTAFPKLLINMYNDLPEETEKITVKEIDATGAAITELGFNHLKGCKAIDTVILDDCSDVDDLALAKLSFIKNTLEVLQVSKCDKVSGNGLHTVKELVHLKKLRCYDLAQVADILSVARQIRLDLPNCEVFTSNEPAKFLDKK